MVDFAARWADPARRQAMLSSARLVVSEPTPMGTSSRLLAVDQAEAGHG